MDQPTKHTVWVAWTSSEGEHGRDIYADCLTEGVYSNYESARDGGYTMDGDHHRTELRVDSMPVHNDCVWVVIKTDNRHTCDIYPKVFLTMDDAHDAVWKCAMDNCQKLKDAIAHYECQFTHPIVDVGQFQYEGPEFGIVPIWSVFKIEYEDPPSDIE
jgi:hypothetical protein